MLHDCITKGGVGVVIGGVNGNKIVGVFEFVEPVVHMGCDEETAAINFLGVVGVECIWVWWGGLK